MVLFLRTISTIGTPRTCVLWEMVFFLVMKRCSLLDYVKVARRVAFDVNTPGLITKINQSSIS